jgi:hypothetical protein
MTHAEIRQEIWTQLGQPTDLDPTTDVSLNGGPYLDFVVNEAQRQIAFWKDPVTRTVYRYPQLYSEMFFQTVVLTGTLEDQTAASSNTVVLTSPLVGDDDRYNGWVLTVGGETKLVVDFVGASLLATVHSAWNTQPTDGTAFTLSKRFVMLGVGTEPWISEHVTLPSTATNMRTEGNLMEILKVEDLNNLTELPYMTRVDSGISQILTTGTPTQWRRQGNRIVFDVASDTATWYRMEYYRLPTPTVEDADLPELPEYLHYPMVLWGKWWGWTRAQDDAKAYATKRDLTDMMRGLTTLQEVKTDRRSLSGTLRRS